MNPDLMNFLYTKFLKPILFAVEPEKVHDIFTQAAIITGKVGPLKSLTKFTFDYQNSNLEREVAGIKFRNPVGLSAGYDYDGHFLKMLPQIGFGFSTVGTVTNIPYEGNSGPMFARLPKSKSLLVNKGFKNDGAKVISARLNDPQHKDITFGISIGSSNVPEINTVSKAIDDYAACFETMDKVPYHKFYELNISCPNIDLANSFVSKENFTLLVTAIKNFGITRPIFVKMSNELSDEELEVLVKTALDVGITGFIFSNLVKDRSNPVFDKQEIEKVTNLKGNFSGKPTQEGSNKHIKYFKQKFGKELVLIGTGGIFNGHDAQTKLDLGADLVQLITGMIFEGPQLIGQINRYLATNLERK